MGWLERKCRLLLRNRLLGGRDLLVAFASKPACARASNPSLTWLSCLFAATATILISGILQSKLLAGQIRVR